MENYKKEWLDADVEYINYSLKVIIGFESAAAKRSLESSRRMFTLLTEIIVLIRIDISNQIKQMEEYYGSESIRELLKRSLGTNIIEGKGTKATNNIFGTPEPENVGNTGS